jgi:hypothetical protein
MIASASVGVDVSLTDLYPDKYPSADPPGGAKFFYAEALEQPRLLEAPRRCTLVDYSGGEICRISSLRFPSS